MLNTLWLVVLTVLVLQQGYYMRKLEKELEEEIDAIKSWIKSWYPFCEIMKMRISKKEDKKS